MTNANSLLYFIVICSAQSMVVLTYFPVGFNTFSIFTLFTLYSIFLTLFPCNFTNSFPLFLVSSLVSHTMFALFNFKLVFFLYFKNLIPFPKFLSHSLSQFPLDLYIFKLLLNFDIVSQWFFLKNFPTVFSSRRYSNP